MKKLLILGAMLVLALIGAPAASAHDPQDDYVQVGDATVLGPVQVRGDVARVHVRYSCTVGNHIWVSVKQSATGAIDPKASQEGSGFGGGAASWYQSHRGTFTCDGERHVQWFDVDQLEDGSRGQLRRGFGYVQFCITTEEGLAAVVQQWTRVLPTAFQRPPRSF